MFENKVELELPNLGAKIGLICLVQEWNDNLSASWVEFLSVLTVELLSVVDVLLDGPNKHLTSTDQSEQEGSNSHGHQTEEEPFRDLNSVVWTGDEIEQETLWNSSDSGASWSQVAQNNVADQVANHHQNNQTSKNVGPVVTSRSNIQWMQSIISNIVGTSSVVSSVLENVQQWHVTVTKLVNENSLKLSLQKMDDK